MGRRYTLDEINQIQALLDEGLTNRDIATRLSRSEAGIRNIRHRTKLKTDSTKNLQTLLENERELTDQKSRLQREITTLTGRRDELRSVLRMDEQVLNQRLQTALIKLKDEKPELFRITAEEQLTKLMGELTGVFIHWLIAK